MELEQLDPVLLGAHTVEDDEGIPVEVIELGALVEALVVLDHEWMQVEEAPQLVDLVVLRAFQVEPEELVAAQ